jgi:hypothetical protein
MRRTHMLRAAMLAAILLPAVGCGSSSNLTADEAANRISDLLVAGEVDEADDIFDDVDGDDHYRETVYSVVYARAGDMYRKQKWSVAAVQLRFLTEHYENAAAPRQALLYTLLRQRAEQDKAPSSKEVKEVKQLVKTIRKAEEHPSPFVALAAAQAAVDEGRVDEARKEYDAFRAGWDGQPRELLDYTVEFDRYFMTNGGSGA